MRRLRLNPRRLILGLLALWAGYSILWVAEYRWLRQQVERVVAEASPGRPRIRAAQTRYGLSPFAVSVDLAGISIEHIPALPGAVVSLPVLTVTVRPWSPRHGWIDGAQGFAATSAERRLTAGAIRGRIAGAGGGADSALAVELDASDLRLVDPGRRGAAESVHLALTVPLHVPADHTATALGFAAILRNLDPGEALAPLDRRVDTVEIEGSVQGAIPPKPLGAALADWRDAGGTIEISKIAVRWGTLNATGSGTVALDPAIQPLAAFGTEVSGYEAVLDALAAGGALRPDAKQYLRIGLDLLARPGPDGRKVLRAPVTLQNGALFVGPAKLARLPHIDWP